MRLPFMKPKTYKLSLLGFLKLLALADNPPLAIDGIAKQSTQMIKCPDCKKDVSASATACPSCGFPVAKTLAAPERQKENLEKKKGCGGCLVILGILILIAGFGTFISARKSANELVLRSWEIGGPRKAMLDNALAKAVGHSSYPDYITKQNEDSGLFFVAVGVVLGFVGYRMCKNNSAKKDSP